MVSDLVRRLYFNDWVRIPVKFVFTFMLMKVGYDYYMYATMYRTRRSQPRSVHMK